METPVVLIHGTNAGPWTLSNFADYFRDQGFSVHCPAYRHHDPLPSPQHAEVLQGLSIADYVEDVATSIATLDRPPILIGHSLGGIVAQKLASQNLVRAIILLNGSVNWGILPTTPAERELGRLFISAGAFWEDTLLPDFETMSRFGLNKLAPQEQRRVFDRLGPESGRVMFELFLWMFDEHRTTQIDYDTTTCPILMISGSEDLAVPPSTSRQIAARYGERVTFHEAAGHGHYLTLEPGWPELAARCARWMETQVKP
ncbi:MAG: alpha/beta hydrolase [Planctomycetota bacterium]